MQIQHAQARGETALIEAIGLIDTRVAALVSFHVEEALALVAHQFFEELAMVFLHLSFEVFKEELFG